MEGIYHTLQEFMLHTESVTYILILCTLVGIAWFWGFLSERDDDPYT